MVSCEQLNDTTWRFGSIALYCAGPKNIGAPNENVTRVTNTKQISLLKPAPKSQNSTLPHRLWWVPFWKGLILVGNPDYQEFEVLSSETCYDIRSYLKVYQVPRCWNGTRAKVACFDRAQCNGSPMICDAADEKVLDTRFCKPESDSS